MTAMAFLGSRMLSSRRGWVLDGDSSRQPARATPHRSIPTPSSATAMGTLRVHRERSAARRKRVIIRSKLLRLSLPEPTLGSTIEGRRVDGSAIRQVLGVRLLYPGYQAGVLASLVEEGSISIEVPA